MYPVIAVPPFDSGGLKLTVACLSPLTAVTAVGAPGAVAVGVMMAEAIELGPVPMALAALTVKLYRVLYVSPVTVRGLEAPEIDKPPGFEVTVYDVIGLPPLNGAAKAIVAL
jgi:hypothetical protein